MTSWPNRILAVIPSSAATRRRYSQISGCGEKLRVQPGLGANETPSRAEETLPDQFGEGPGHRARVVTKGLRELSLTDPEPYLLDGRVGLDIVEDLGGEVGDDGHGTKG